MSGSYIKQPLAFYMDECELLERQLAVAIKALDFYSKAKLLPLKINDTTGKKAREAIQEIRRMGGIR